MDVNSTRGVYGLHFNPHAFALISDPLTEDELCRVSQALATQVIVEYLGRAGEALTRLGASASLSAELLKRFNEERLALGLADEV